MKLLLWLSPVLASGKKDETRFEEIETMPRSERFPPHPPHDDDQPYDPVAQAEMEKEIRYYLHI